MFAKLKLLPLALLLTVAGCCQPKGLFSFIDRHCFVADWTNDHSCLSCRRCANHQPPPAKPFGPPILAPQTTTSDADPANVGEVDAVAK